MKAKGNTKKILQKVGEIQDLVGLAMANHANDKNTDAYEKGQEQLKKAFDICLEITGMYDPI